MVRAKTRKKKIVATPQSITKGVQVLAYSLIVILGVRFIAQDLIAPILLAIFLSALFAPLFGWFRKKGASGVVSLILVIVTIIASLAGLALFFYVSYGIFSEYLSELAINLKTSLSASAEEAGVNPDLVEPLTALISPNIVLGLIRGIIANAGVLLLYLFLVPVLAMLILLQVDSIPEKSKEKFVKENKVIQKVAAFSKSVIVYISARFKVNLITALLTMIVYFFFGIPFLLLWGIVTLILAFVPFIGLTLAGIIPVLIVFTKFGFLGAGILILCLVVINILAENIFEPLIQGKKQKLTAASLIFSFIFWTWIFGPIGAILTAPLTVLLKVIFADYRETAWIASLMEGNYAKAKLDEESFKRVKKVMKKFSFKKLTSLW